MRAHEDTNFDEDDGRVICSMDVEGMRWHDQRVSREKFQAAQAVSSGQQLTASEARRYTFYAVLSGLLVALVFSSVWVLFILFCTEIWFR